MFRGIYFFVSMRLHTGWVKHDADLSSDCLWWQVSLESATDDTIGSVSSGNLSPVDAELVAVFVCRGTLGDKGDLLSEIEFSIGLGVDALNLDQRNVVVLVTKTSLVTQDGTFNVKSGGSL